MAQDVRPVFVEGNREVARAQYENTKGRVPRRPAFVEFRYSLTEALREMEGTP